MPDPSPNTAIIPTFRTTRPDPYPERSTNDTGVRHHTSPYAVVVWKVTHAAEHSGHLPFVAIPPTGQASSIGGRLKPWASVGLYALGQVILALAIAAGSIDPALGIVVCLLWMGCGLLLIAAEVVSQTAADATGTERRR